ncbi:MAG: hypothetical protein KW802_00220 [Candidatus Doudnabacteria bacterium]|nr:hypothetical protein [Candidatus Doudnabacteria bacterium]
MQNRDWSDTARRVAGGILMAAGVGTVVYASLIIADFLTFYWIYSSMEKMLEDFGTVESLAKLVGIVFAAVVTLATHGLMWHIIRRNKHQWVPRIALVMVCWYGAMFVVASPYEGGLFNPFTGAPQAKFVKMPDGNIKKFPLGLQYDPETGRSLSDFDTATADEYNAQYGVNSKSLYGPVRESVPLVMGVESVGLSKEGTVLRIAVKRRSYSTEIATFYPPDRVQTYLVDQKGQIYNLLEDGAGYQTPVYPDSHKPLGADPNPYGHYAWRKELKPEEVYRFNMTFDPINSGVQYLKYYDSRFSPVTIWFQDPTVQRRPVYIPEKDD